jgi:hypothetical protein
MSDKLLTVDEQIMLQETEGLEPYIFLSPFGDRVFALIEEEMEELNDFCVIYINAVEDALNREKAQSKKYSSGQHKFIHPEIGDVTENALMGLEDFVIPKWEQIHSFLSHANCLLLLHIFTEKSLKSLCINYAPDKLSSAKQIKGISKIDSYLQYLNKTCNFSFKEPNGATELRDGIRRIRNAFAHGDWDIVRKTTQKYSLRKSFYIITTLFRSIEEAIKKSKV